MNKVSIAKKVIRQNNNSMPLRRFQRQIKGALKKEARKEAMRQTED